MLTAGQTFARYVIEAAIGEGGMGEVYRAFDEKLRRKVALKVLHPDLAVPDAAARLVREARAAAAFAHPNTISIYDLGEIDGTVFLVMELIEGAPLRAFIGDETLPLTKRLRWLVDIARGLGAAHKAGLVHRDVKPANVMISDDGVVKVLDFGLAKPVEASSLNTDVGLVVGTPRYMAPELFAGIRADARSDQYAFGVTAYELLSGAHPGNPMGAVPAALDTLVPALGPAIARIVARTLSRDATQRFATMNEVATALEEQIATTRVSEVREASPATRREGAPGAPAGPAAPAAAAALALAHAPTELPSSATAASRAASRMPSDMALPRPVASTLAPARRGGLLPLVVALGLLGAGGAYAASRVLATDATGTLVDASSSFVEAGDDGATAAIGLEADAAQDVAQPTPAIDADASATIDAAIDASSTDADTTSPPHSLPLDEFADPWAKRAPPPPAPPPAPR